MNSGVIDHRKSSMLQQYSASNKGANGVASSNAQLSAVNLSTNAASKQAAVTAAH